VQNGQSMKNVETRQAHQNLPSSFVNTHQTCQVVYLVLDKIHAFTNPLFEKFEKMTFTLLDLHE
jgi:hypothetical protein